MLLEGYLASVHSISEYNFIQGLVAQTHCSPVTWTDGSVLFLSLISDIYLQLVSLSYKYPLISKDSPVGDGNEGVLFLVLTLYVGGNLILE